MVCEHLFFKSTFSSVDTYVLRKPNRFILSTVQAHSAKADQNPYVLRTPGLLKMCLNAALNQIALYLYGNNQINWASSQNVLEQVAETQFGSTFRTPGISSKLESLRSQSGTSFSAAL